MPEPPVDSRHAQRGKLPSRNASDLQPNVIDLTERLPLIARQARATYTVPEVAALLGMSRANTYALLASGEIPARRLGSRWIIPRHRFAQWLNDDPVNPDPQSRGEHR